MSNYTTINKSTDYFNTKLYTGNGSTQSVTGAGFQPDWVWIKERDDTSNHNLYDSVRGVQKYMYSNENTAEQTGSNSLTAFDSDGFSVGNGSFINQSSQGYASWNWKAGGTAPAITYVVKVVSDSGNKYRFDDFGTSAVTLDLQEGGTYTFDQSDSSNSGHPLRFYTAADKTGGEYTTGVTTNGTPGSSGAYTRITVAASAPTLYYQCSNHAGMGGQANTNSLFGSSNFGGSIQSTISAGTTQGFNIVSYTGTGVANATIGHGLGVTPAMIIVKNRSITENWRVWHQKLGGADYKLALDSTGVADQSATVFNGQSATTFTVGTDPSVNGSGNNIIAYCFAEKIGYSKFGTYTGNGNADGTFVYTGFKPAFVLTKSTSNAVNWQIQDNKIAPHNLMVNKLFANTNAAQDTGSENTVDFYSNGFKPRGTGSSENNNGNGYSYIYMAFGQSLVGSNNIPCTAR